MELADILSEESVLVCPDITTKREVLVKLSEKVAALTGQSQTDIFEALSDREALGSTGLGNGIAVPHGKFTPLKGVMAVFMKLTTPVEFESVDDQPVDIVMMLLAPIGSGADHLKALGRVARILRREGMPIDEAVSTACRMRLRPILMTSLATVLGMIPMALALEAGSEQYAPLARAIIGGLIVSVVLTVYIVPAAYLWIHRKEEQSERSVEVMAGERD